MKTLTTCLVICVIAGSLGCAGVTQRFASVELDGSRYEKLGYGEASAGGVLLFGVIPIRQHSKTRRAIAAAIASKGGDDLIDVKIRETWYYAVVLTGFRVHVEGMVVKKR